MEEYIQFAINHWILISLFVALLIWLLVEEARAKGLMGQLSPQEAVQLINRDRAVVIDIRNREAFQQGHIVDAINITEQELNKNSDKLVKYKNRPIILVCAAGQKAGALAVKLKNQKMEGVYVLAGGINAWKNAAMPLIKG